MKSTETRFNAESAERVWSNLPSAYSATSAFKLQGISSVSISVHQWLKILNSIEADEGSTVAACSHPGTCPAPSCRQTPLLRARIPVLVRHLRAGKHRCCVLTSQCALLRRARLPGIVHQPALGRWYFTCLKANGPYRKYDKKPVSVSHFCCLCFWESILNRAWIRVHFATPLFNLKIRNPFL